MDLEQTNVPLSTPMKSAFESDDHPEVAGDDEILAALLATGVPVRLPTATLRERVLRAGAPQPLVFLDRFQGIWLPSVDAPVAAKELFCDSRERLSSRLVRMKEGEFLPRPALSGRRQVFVVHGCLASGERVLGVGDALDQGTAPQEWHARQETLALDLGTAGAVVADSVVCLEQNAEWVAQGEGIRLRMVSHQAEQERQLFVVDAHSNATLIEHQHAGIEELYVLSGSCVVEGKEMCAGDYHRATAGTTHGSTHTGDDGCVLLCSLRAVSP